MILDKILKKYYDVIKYKNITRLELSSAAFSVVLTENKDKLIAQSELSKDSMQKMEVNGKPLQVIQDDDIWFEWK